LPFPIKLRVPTKLGFKNPKHFRDMLILGIGGLEVDHKLQLSGLPP
jgi:hypothetical protein